MVKHTKYDVDYKAIQNFQNCIDPFFFFRVLIATATCMHLCNRITIPLTTKFQSTVALFPF